MGFRRYLCLMPLHYSKPLCKRIAILLLATSAACPGVEPVVDAVSFRNDVMAVLSKGGCNSGPCHGNQNGKAGFKLSLRGEDPVWDFRVLTRDAFARRTNPTEPDQSLVLLKVTTQLAHEGGCAFARILQNMICSGAGSLRASPTTSPPRPASNVSK